MILFGCRTPHPDLKPPPHPEILGIPPPESRFETAALPKEAMLPRKEPMRRLTDDGVTQAGGPGNFGASSMGGPGR